MKVSFWKENLLFSIFSGLVLLLLFLAVIAPWIVPYDPFHTNLAESMQSPSLHHWFGTDRLGRDIFSRVLLGAQYSLGSVLLVVGLVFVIGTTLGVLAGYFGGIVDVIIMRLSEIMISFPGMILAIAVAGILGGSLVNAVLAVVVVSWTKYARLARSIVLKIKKRDYIEAAVINGGTNASIIWRHILPNTIPIAVITAATDIGGLLMELAGLSFLGFGAQAPAPEWGVMLSEGRAYMQTAPWLMICPGIAICISVIVFNLWGDALRDVLDPRQEN